MLALGKPTGVEAVKRIPVQLKLRLERARARHGVVDVVMQTFKSFSLDDGGSYAAALTYYTFFSVFPLMLFAASILGYLTQDNAQLRQDILEAGVESVPLIRDILSPAGIQFFQERAGSMAITATILALYSGTGAIVALGHALNRINNVYSEGNWFQKRIKALRWLVLLGLAGVCSLALGALAGYAGELFDEDPLLGGRKVEVVGTGDESEPLTATIRVGGQDLKLSEGGETTADGYRVEEIDGECVTLANDGDTVILGPASCRPLTFGGIVGFTLGHIAGFILNVALFASAFRFLPNGSLSWRDVLPGALVASFAFEVLKEVGTWYLQRGAEGREAAFGVFASAAGLLVASYLLAQVTLLAAELNDVLAERRMTRQATAGEQEESQDGTAG